MHYILLIGLGVLILMQARKTLMFVASELNIYGALLMFLMVIAILTIQIVAATLPERDFLVGATSSGLCIIACAVLAATFKSAAKQFDRLETILNQSQDYSDLQLEPERKEIPYYPNWIPFLVSAMATAISNNSLWYVTGTIGLCLFVPIFVLKAKLLR